MPRTEFRGPTGERIPDLRSDTIEALLARADDYWEKGSGDSEITFLDAQRTPRIMLLPRASLGVHMQYFSAPKEYDSLVSIDPETESRVVEVWVGGERHYLPRSTFVDKTMAVAAVQEFLERGEASAAVTWRRRSEIDWPDVDE